MRRPQRKLRPAECPLEKKPRCVITASGPRVLLKRLRELMAEPLEPQERLDRIVRDIAANMVAEVCSLYVLRADSACSNSTPPRV